MWMCSNARNYACFKRLCESTELIRLNWSWAPYKNEDNKRKHSIGFEVAQYDAFNAPLAVTTSTNIGMKSDLLLSE